MNSLLSKILRDDRLPLRLRKKIGNRLHVPSNIPFTVPLHGACYSGVTGNLIDDKAYLYGAHEAATLRLIKTILNFYRRTGGRDITYVDIGVNSGLHLVCGALHADHAVGFEPWARVRDIAQANIDRNPDLIAKTRLFPVGLSDADSTLPFYPPAGNNLGVGSFVPDHASVRHEALSLTVRAGDDVMHEHSIIPTLIKIDTEGFEKQVLTGLRDTIARYRPAIIFEYSGETHPEIADPTMRATLFPGPYQFYGLARSREYPALRPFHPQGKYENVLAWSEDTDILSILKDHQ